MGAIPLGGAALEETAPAMRSASLVPSPRVSGGESGGGGPGEQDGVVVVDGPISPNREMGRASVHLWLRRAHVVFSGHDTDLRQLTREVSAGDPSVADLLRNLVAKVDGLTQKQDDLSQTVGGINTSVAEMRQKQDDLSQTVGELSQTVGGIAMRQKDLGDSVYNVGSGVKRLERARDKDVKLRELLSVTRASRELQRILTEDLEREGEEVVVFSCVLSGERLPCPGKVEGGEWVVKEVDGVVLLVAVPRVAGAAWEARAVGVAVEVKGAKGSWATADGSIELVSGAMSPGQTNEDDAHAQLVRSVAGVRAALQGGEADPLFAKMQEVVVSELSSARPEWLRGEVGPVVARAMLAAGSSVKGILAMPLMSPRGKAVVHADGMLTATEVLGEGVVVEPRRRSGACAACANVCAGFTKWRECIGCLGARGSLESLGEVRIRFVAVGKTWPIGWAGVAHHWELSSVTGSTGGRQARCVPEQTRAWRPAPSQRERRKNGGTCVFTPPYI